MASSTELAAKFGLISLATSDTIKMAAKMASDYTPGKRAPNILASGKIT